MLGFGDFSIFLVYVLCIVSTVVCIVYGVINWNKDGEEDKLSDEKWDSDEKTMKDKLDI